MVAKLDKLAAFLLAKFDTKPFYRSIDEDLVLARDRAAWNVFRFLSACWVKDGCASSRQLEIGIKTISARLKYKNHQHVSSIVNRLSKLGYLDYTPGSGFKGQAKNKSQLSVMVLHFPIGYCMPQAAEHKSKFTDEQLIKMAKITLVRNGVREEELNLLVADGLADRAIYKAKAAARVGRPQIKLFKEAGCLRRKSDSLKSLVPQGIQEIEGYGKTIPTM